MKFRFYITDTQEGAVEGTDNEVFADLASQSERFFVVDSETGEQLTTTGRQPIVEMF